MSGNSYTAYYMTVCLAGLYEDGKGAVLVTDKMVTYKGGLLKEEVFVDREDVSKVYKFKQMTVMLSGSRDLGQKILRKASSELKTARYAEEAAEVLTKFYREGRDAHVFDKVLSPLFFRDYDHYHQACKANTAWLLQNRELRDYPFDVSFLLVGKNRNHHYEVRLVVDGSQSLNTEGMGAIGSGYAYAFSTVTHEHRPSMSKREVKKILLKAKKEAEQARDVGILTSVKYLK